MAEMLGHPLTEAERVACISSSVKGAVTGELSMEDFTTWWNSESLNPHLIDMVQNRTATHESIQGTGAMFG